jgi:hypothetical protein
MQVMETRKRVLGDEHPQAVVELVKECRVKL